MDGYLAKSFHRRERKCLGVSRKVKYDCFKKRNAGVFQDGGTEFSWLLEIPTHK